MSSCLSIHWNSFTPNKWKWGKIKSLVHRALDIFSNNQCLEIQLKHIQSSFNKING